MTCPMCGAGVQANANRCDACGEPLQSTASDGLQKSRPRRWIINPSRRVKRIVGGATIWSVAYFVLFMTSGAIAVAVQVLTGRKSIIDDYWFWIIAPAHIATIFINFALLWYYTTFLFHSERFKIRQRVGWLFLFMFTGGFAMLVFFNRYVRQCAQDGRHS